MTGWRGACCNELPANIELPTGIGYRRDRSIEPSSKFVELAPIPAGDVGGQNRAYRGERSADVDIAPDGQKRCDVSAEQASPGAVAPGRPGSGRDVINGEVAGLDLPDRRELPADVEL